MLGSIQAGADIIDNSGYHGNSAFNFQLKNNVSGKRAATYFPPGKISSVLYLDEAQD